jgi:hypothetical protein
LRFLALRYRACSYLRHRQDCLCCLCYRTPRIVISPRF